MGALEHLHLLASDVNADCLSDGEESEEIEEVLDRGFGSRSELTRPIEEAVKILLQGLGEDCNREGLRKTPLRVAKAFRDATRGYKQKVDDIVQGALFPESGPNTGKGLAGGVGGLVVVRDIVMFSCCESCLLPFRVHCHVAYIPCGERVVGLSKLARVAEVFAKRLQSPQRLADEICYALQNSIRPAGVSVVLQCSHIQFPDLSKANVRKKQPSSSDTQGWIQTLVCSRSGAFMNEKYNFWFEFLSLLKFKGIEIEENIGKCSSNHPWCASIFSVHPHNGHGFGHTSPKGHSRQIVSESGMTEAVKSILKAIGEDPLRKELAITPYRFVQWMLCFKKCTFDVSMNMTKDECLESQANGVLQEDNKDMRYQLSLPFCAQCEHHLLPFCGVVHIAYLYNEENGALERSFLQSIVHFYGCKLQVQERLTRQIAEAVASILDRGVMVVVEASHICMLSRGIEKIGSSTATIAVIGEFASNSEAKETFVQSIQDSRSPGR